jgi:hypothetical protein
MKTCSTVCKSPQSEWHEKLFTDTDKDKYIIDINDDIKNTDFWAIVKFCCIRWNLDIPEERQMTMGG